MVDKWLDRKPTVGLITPAHYIGHVTDDTESSRKFQTKKLNSIIKQKLTAYIYQNLKKDFFLIDFSSDIC